MAGHREAAACSAANAFKVGARASSIYCTPNALLLFLLFWLLLLHIKCCVCVKLTSTFYAQHR